MFCQKCGNKLVDGSQVCSVCGASVTVVPVGESVSVKESSSAWVRLANYLVDVIAQYLLIFIFNAIVFSLLDISSSVSSSVKDGNLGIMAMIFLWSMLEYVGYYVFFEALWQRTPGKWVTKTKVVKRDGSKPSFGCIVGRSFARYIPFEAFSFLGKTASGWHDSLTDTIVVPASYTPEDMKNLKPSSKGGALWIILPLFVLVIIAVIGIFSSVVLVSLNSARMRGMDTAIRADVTALVSESLIYHDANNGYTNFCDEPATKRYLSSALVASGRTDVTYVCNDGLNVWLVSTPLKSKGFLCMDNSRNSPIIIEKQLTNERSCVSTTEVTNQTATPVKSQGWIVYEAPTKDFSISFPGNPKVQIEDNTLLSKGVYVDTHSYVSENDVNAFLLIKLKYSISVVLDKDINKSLVGFSDSFVKGMGATIVSSSFTNYKGNPALDLVLLSGEGHARARFIFLDGSTYYIALMSSDSAEVPVGDYESFVNSLNIIN